MAKVQGLSIDIGVTIPEDTVDRCLAILSMWLTDNPNMTLEVGENGVVDRFVYFREVREKKWEKQND